MISLHDLKPKRTLVKIKEKEYFLRPITLNDEIWIRQNFDKTIFDDFANGSPNFGVISEIIYHQLEDKSDFKPVEKVDYDSEGNEIKARIGGHKLLASLIVGMEEKIALITALNDCMGVTKELVEKIESEKKNPQ